MPNTDGAAFGYRNYCSLLDAGYGADDVHRAMSKLTGSLREDYPSRSARYFPHAERLLDPGNPSGIMRFLAPGASKPVPEPTDRELLIFAITGCDRETSIEAQGLNDALAAACDADELERAQAAQRAWLEGHRAELSALWRKARMKGRR